MTPFDGRFSLPRKNIASVESIEIVDRNVLPLNSIDGLFLVVACAALRYCIRKLSIHESKSWKVRISVALIAALTVLTKFSARPFDLG